MWKLLGERDVNAAYRAIWAIARMGDRGVALIARNLGDPIDAKRIARLIIDLDVDEYAVRTRATEELIRAGAIVLPAVRKAVATTKSPEVTARGRRIIETLAGVKKPAGLLRRIRAMHALRMIATPRAKALLRKLGPSAPTAAK